MKCEDCLFYYDDYIDEELNASEVSEISEHLAACPSCSFSYREFGREEEIFKHHLLKAEATPALWKNLQSAIENEKIVPITSSTTTISGKFKEVFGNFNLIFSPRGMALSGLAVVVACAIIFLLVSHKNNPVEYAGLDPEISPASQLTESISNQPSLKVGTEKGISQAERNQPFSTTTAKQFKATRIKRSIERITPVPKRTERKKTETVAARHESSKELLPGEQKYLEIIAGLTEEVKSIEPMMPKVLSEEYQRNLSAVDKAIEETRKSARRHPKNQDVMNFVTTAYQGKIALLSEAARR
ncbi:MAG TPA: zf-HC2 domain-containing protein [Pyrinomonadaceae bacterium]|nr:zf-HC2 domain-containing protein [Pyrinomonadaceae bacterium]